MWVVRPQEQGQLATARVADYSEPLTPYRGLVVQPTDRGPEVLEGDSCESVRQRAYIEVCQRERGEPVASQERSLPHHVGRHPSLRTAKHQHTRDRPTSRGPEEPTVEPALADVGACYLVGKEVPVDLDVSRLAACLRGDEQGLWTQGAGVRGPVTVGRPHEAHRVRPRVAAFYRGLAGYIHRPQVVGPKRGPRPPLHVVGVDESRAQGHALPGRKVLQSNSERFVDPGGIGANAKLPAKTGISARLRQTPESGRRQARRGDAQEAPPCIAPPGIGRVATHGSGVRTSPVRRRPESLRPSSSWSNPFSSLA